MLVTAIPLVGLGKSGDLCLYFFRASFIAISCMQLEELPLRRRRKTNLLSLLKRSTDSAADNGKEACCHIPEIFVFCTVYHLWWQNRSIRAVLSRAAELASRHASRQHEGVVMVYGSSSRGRPREALIVVSLMATHAVWL